MQPIALFKQKNVYLNKYASNIYRINILLSRRSLFLSPPLFQCILSPKYQNTFEMLSSNQRYKCASN